jgi:hypothetical protein
MGSATVAATSAFFALVAVIVGIKFLRSATRAESAATGNPDVAKTLENGMKLFTDEMLRLHDGSDPSKPLLLCVLGEVFDVTSGAKHYGKGSGYNVFVGKDGSRSFHSGDWNNPQADVRDLNVMAIADVIGWREFYRKHETYNQVGYMIGLYYDENGNPTTALQEVEAVGAKAADVKSHEDKLMKTYPGCDMAHTAADRKTKISCTSDDEPRYPRLLTWKHIGTGETARRCACFSGRELSRKLDVGEVEVYAGCQASDRACTIQQ